MYGEGRILLSGDDHPSTHDEPSKPEKGKREFRKKLNVPNFRGPFVYPKCHDARFYESETNETEIV